MKRGLGYIAVGGRAAGLQTVADSGPNAEIDQIVPSTESRAGQIVAAGSGAADVAAGDVNSDIAVADGTGKSAAGAAGTGAAATAVAFVVKTTGRCKNRAVKGAMTRQRWWRCSAHRDPKLDD